jgi:hypothetical protein
MEAVVRIDVKQLVIAIGYAALSVSLIGCAAAPEVIEQSSALRSMTLFPSRNRLTSEIGPGAADTFRLISRAPRNPSLLGDEA